MTLTEKKIEEILNNAQMLNIKLNPVKILLSLHQNGELTQFNIEKSTNLRQPEVSLAIKNLFSEGFLDYSTINEGGKGRPVKNYRLKKPITEYFEEIRKEKENDYLLSKFIIADIIDNIK